MKKNHYPTLIIGAGPAGLACAMELFKANAEFAVVEKSEMVGGLAKTYEIKEGDLSFRTDNGPHRFFSKNQYLYDFIGGILKDDWVVVNRQTRQYINGKFLDYPVNAVQVIKTLGFFTILRAGLDYVLASVRYKIFKRPINNFYDYAIANFGKSLADLNIIGYTEKIWGVSAKQLHADWAKQRIKGLSLRTLAVQTFKKFFQPKKAAGLKTLVDTFYYPASGTGSIYETITQRLREAGREVETKTFPVKIGHNGKKILWADLSQNGTITRLTFDQLVESVYLPEFLNLLDPLPPVEVLAAAKKLKGRSQVHLFLTLNKDQVTTDQWVYFTDRAVPFARSSEMKNFSPKMSPPGKTSLWIEFFCNQDDEIYHKTAEQLLELALPYFEKFNFFKRADVRYAYRFAGGNDYPIYDLTYLDNLKIVKNYLNNFSNLYYIGRPGRFQYTNQDHSLEMGILSARSILSKQPFDLEQIGTETEYFEKGLVPPKQEARQVA